MTKLRREPVIKLTKKVINCFFFVSFFYTHAHTEVPSSAIEERVTLASTYLLENASATGSQSSSGPLAHQVSVITVDANNNCVSNGHQRHPQQTSGNSNSLKIRSGTTTSNTTTITNITNNNLIHPHKIVENNFTVQTPNLRTSGSIHNLNTNSTNGINSGSSGSSASSTATTIVEVIELDVPAHLNSNPASSSSGASITLVSHPSSSVGPLQPSPACGGSQGKLAKIHERRPRPLLRHLTDMEINSHSLNKGKRQAATKSSVCKLCFQCAFLASVLELVCSTFDFRTISNEEMPFLRSRLIHF